MDQQQEYEPEAEEADEKKSYKSKKRTAKALDAAKDGAAAVKDKAAAAAGRLEDLGQKAKAGAGRAAGKADDLRARAAVLLKEAKRRLRIAGQWSFIHLRRIAHGAGEALAVHRAVGPVSFLAVSAAVSVAFTLSTLYTTSYAVTVDGTPVAVVADRGTVTEAIQTVETQGSALLGYPYQVRGQVDYQFGLSLKTDLTDPTEIENFFYSQLDEVSGHLRKCEVLVDGKSVGVVKDEAALNDMLDEIKDQYVNENTIEAGFVENVVIDHVFVADDMLTVTELEDILTANTTGETTYTAKAGDSLSRIAYNNDMSIPELLALNPGREMGDMIWVGDTLNVKEEIPFLSVETKEHQTYTEAIPCPVEEKEDSSMYKGDSKILTQGEEGEALVEADVVYVNGYEKEREILSSTTLKEPTTTVKAVGTKPKPKTASKGTYQWPIKGKINSYFGGRYIFGGYSYHSGIDIQASYGATIKAADGGTVTTAGYKGTYGNLVVITHDNGTQTYYAHNSSLLVSVGQKVYQGQAIAKAGATGRASGPHCHFEVRVNGKAVNPLNYLP